MAPSFLFWSILGLYPFILFVQRLLIFLFMLYNLHFIEIPLRLQGPSSADGTGRVEIFYNETWGTICDDSWDIHDASVVCRQLGYRYVVSIIPGHQLSDGTGQIWLDDVACTGKEQNLSSCNHNGWGTHNCGHHSDAGVNCSSTVLSLLA